MAVKVPGTLVGSGRNADVYDVGDGRVLRRYRDGRDTSRVAAEAQVMAHARACGVPVPEVFDVSGADIVMERAVGPTMLDAVGRRPWTFRSHARLLARLHDLVHQVPASGLAGLALRSPFGAGRPDDDHVLLHTDLHPQNVILTGTGPVIIDWEGASYGPAIVDVALTWVIVGYSEVPPAPRVQVAVMRAFQGAFTRSFVRAAGPVEESWRHTAIRLRLADPNTLPTEAVRLERLAGSLLPGPRGRGAEDREVTVLLAGRGRVVGVADGQGDGGEPVGAVAQLVAGELSAHVGEGVTVARRGGRDHAVEFVDAGVERPMVGARQADAEPGAEVVEIGIADDDDLRVRRVRANARQRRVKQARQRACGVLLTRGDGVLAGAC